MQTELLRDLLDRALEEPDERTRVGCFWVFACDYDDCISEFRKIFNNEDLASIDSPECKVTRIKEGFLIEDPYGRKDIYSNDEMSFLIDLWEKTLLAELDVNRVDMTGIPKIVNLELEEH